jgi:hypothetical protein
MQTGVYLRYLLSITAFIVIAVSASLAQDGRNPAGDGRTLELVDELKEMIQKAETVRSKDGRLVQELRELIRRYDWPWRVSLLYDDFRDGDYAADPTWIVKRGEFWVSQGGLRTRFETPTANRKVAGTSPVDIFEGIFRGITARRFEPQGELWSGAEIHTDLRITNGFAVRLDIGARGYFQEGSRLEFGPYQGSQRDRGYRLAYEAGQRPSVTLLRVMPERSFTIESYDAIEDLDDGRTHQIEWRRVPGGEMIVFLDGKEIIRTLDAANHDGLDDGFDGFTIANKGGDYTIRQIAIFGMAN